METKIISIGKIEKEDGRWYLYYVIEYKDGTREDRAKVFDNFREAGINKNDLKAFINRWVKSDI